MLLKMPTNRIQKTRIFCSYLNLFLILPEAPSAFAEFFLLKKRRKNLIFCSCDEKKMDFQDEFGFGASFGAPQAIPAHGHPNANNPEEQFSGKMQAQMWQEQHYMGGPRGNNPESGFISASTSHPSSRNGHEDLHEDGCYTGPGSIVSGSLYDMDSAAHSGKGFLVLL